MVDSVSPETRSKMMKSIRSVSKLESIVTRDLWHKGLRFRRNSKSLYGSPDISIMKYKVVVFIDSCFWHYCDVHGHYPKSNVEYWEKKILRNKQRDAEITSYYLKNNWNILRVWEHQLKEDYDGTVGYIYEFILKAKNREKGNR